MCDIPLLPTGPTCFVYQNRKTACHIAVSNCHRSQYDLSWDELTNDESRPKTLRYHLHLTDRAKGAFCERGEQPLNGEIHPLFGVFSGVFAFTFKTKHDTNTFGHLPLNPNLYCVRQYVFPGFRLALDLRPECCSVTNEAPNTPKQCPLDA